MPFSIQPKEIKSHILSFVHPHIDPYLASGDEIKGIGKNLLNISLVNREFSELCLDKLKAVHKTLRAFNLKNKYHYYNKQYTEQKDIYDPKVPPLLYDALSTAYLNNIGALSGSLVEYSPEVESDIKDILDVWPESVKWNRSRERGVYRLTPLFAACVNKLIPMDIIQLLVKKGANPNDVINAFFKDKSILEELESRKYEVTDERLSKIKEIFEAETQKNQQFP